MHLPERKLLWAIDPFEEDVTFRVQLIQLLKTLCHRLHLPVEPTYVLNLSKENELEATHLPHQRHYQQAALKTIQANISTVREVKFMKPKVLFQPDSYFNRLVQKLSEYAVHSGAEAIIVGTHARTGLPRLLLGSFTESLLLQSQIPVITVGPHCKIPSTEIPAPIVQPPKLKILRDAMSPDKDSTLKILFSTDLTESSERMYPYLLNFAEKLNAEIILFHVEAHRIEPVLQTGSYLLGGGWVGAPEQVTPQDVATEELLRQWVARGLERGIQVRSEVGMQRGSIAELITQKAVDSQSDWIAMAAESGPMRAWAIGSITRHVVRNAPCPVWILRPDAIRG